MKKKSIGQKILMVATAVLLAGVILNGLEIIAAAVFRLLVLAGIAIMIAALVVSLRRNEF